ncbi:MAG: outer membrane beta-barrel protein [Flavitalea sp.]
MRKLPLLLGMLLLCSMIYAQSTELRGSVKDTADNNKLHQAVVSLIKKSDSTLVTFSRVNDKGNFQLKPVPQGDYILQITYPKYADYVEEVKLDGSSKEMTGLILTPRSTLLEEVIVRQRIAAIRMKGDTLEFRTDSFAVREGANVEELLKKLPGIQVNRNGEITAQGEKVQKVLVDGEEFFSDDPAVVTQNLSADAVETVQVFDKKSDQATFTGIDDGEKTKTINLKLKENRKQGFFGKARAAGGTPDWFEGEAMVNMFRGKKKIAAFGTAANTGKAGLGWEDNQKFGGSNNMEYNEEEGYFFSFSTQDEFNTWGGRYNGEGLPQAWTGGLHYSNKWNEDKNHINGNYRYYKQNIEVEGTTISQFILPDTSYFQNERRTTFNQNTRNGLDGFYDIKLDSLSSLKVTVNGGRVDGKSTARYISESLDDDSALANTNERLTTSDGIKNNFTASIIYRKKFMKKGRTVSISMDNNYQDQIMSGLLQSNLQFYDGGTIPVGSVIFDQQKINNNNSLAINSRIAYTEPIGKNSFLELNYGYRNNNSESERISYNKGTDGKYDIIDSIFSNNYQFKFNTHSTGLTFRVNQKKLSWYVGSNVSFAKFNQQDIWADTTYKYNFTNLFPKASIRYAFKPQTRLSLNYNGNTRQPSLQQIQPVLDNTNVLNLQIGNPNLKQEFVHTMNLQFNDFKVLSGRSLWMSASLNMTDNAISTSSFINKGVRTTQFVNVSGNYSANFWSGYWLQIKKYNLNVGFNANGNFSRYNNFIDSNKNTNNNTSMGIGTNIGYYKDKKISFNVGPDINFITSRSTLNPNTVTRYWLFNTDASLNVPLPKDFDFNTEAVVSIRQKTPVFTRNVNAVKWNASVGKKFWKNKSGEVRLHVFDILDQNIGFNRNATSNFISENTYNTIRRYWLLSFTWNFNKNPGAPTAK